MIGGTGTTTVTLGDGDDVVKLGGTNNVITLGNGNDFVDPGNGTGHVIIAGNGRDTVVGGTGVSTVKLGDGDDVVKLGGTGNIITLGDGNDFINPGDGTGHRITAGDGSDTVVGGSGANTVKLGDGDNLVKLGGSNNSVTVGDGDDTIDAGTGSAFVSGAGSLSLTLHGGANVVFLSGPRATIDGAADGSVLHVTNIAATITLTDFNSASGAAIALPGAVAPVQDLLDRLRSDGDGGSVLSFGSGGSIHFVDLLPNSLSGGFFVEVRAAGFGCTTAGRFARAGLAGAPARKSAIVARVVICSGFMRSSITAGRPLATARAKAGANASVVSTTSPWPPNASMNLEKSGLVSAVPDTRPG